MSRLDLNIDLDAVARRLSFSLASPSQPPPRGARSTRRQPALPPIAEDPEEQQAAGTPSTSSPWTLPSSCPPLQAPGPVTCWGPLMTYAPAPSVVRTQIVPVSSAPSVSPFQQGEAVAVSPAASLGELDRRCEAELQQQVWTTAGGQPQPQQLRLYTVEGNPAGYKTKWEELHPASQELLLQIEEKTREYMHQSEQLDQCSRLYDPSVSNKGFELDVCQITQEIGLISTIMDRGKTSIQSLMAVIEEIMCNTDFAIHSYVNLRQRFIRRGAGIANAGFGKCAGPSGAPSDFNQPLTKAPTFRCFHGDVMRPSLFMQQIVARFEMQLEECCRMIGELEQVVQMKNGKTHPDALVSLPKVMSNMHDYFIHVAAKVENLHQYAQTIRTQYLNDRRHRGDWNDPFLEADKKDAAKHEAADRNFQFSSRWKNTWEVAKKQRPRQPLGAGKLIACFAFGSRTWWSVVTVALILVQMCFRSLSPKRYRFRSYSFLASVSTLETPICHVLPHGGGIL